MTPSVYTYDPEDNLVRDKSDWNWTRVTGFLRRLSRQSPYYHSQIGAIQDRTENGSRAIWKHLKPTSKEIYRSILQTEALGCLQNSSFITDFSSGSTQNCVLKFSAPEDDQAELEVTLQVFRRAGWMPGDHLLCLEVGVPEIYDFYCRAAQEFGIEQTTFIRLTQDFKTALKPLARLNPTCLMTLPSVLAKAWPHLKSFWPPMECPIHSLIHIGEAMPLSLQQEIQSHWNCRITSFYGTTETGGIGSSCPFQVGCHFDPSRFGLSLLDPKPLAPDLWEGQALWSTFHFTNQAVLKYDVGDRILLRMDPCPCGDPFPRVEFLERTNDTFIITGEKYRYEMIWTTLKSEVPKLNSLKITLDDLPESEGHTLMTVYTSGLGPNDRNRVLQVLQHEIFELDTAFHNGFVQFQVLDERHAEEPTRKKIRVQDRRRFMGVPI